MDKRNAAYPGAQAECILKILIAFRISGAGMLGSRQ